MDLRSLIQKYSVSGPRYTSYPTAPQWSEVSLETYREKLKETTRGGEVGLYVHLPFCESLCYYCGCNIKITKNKSRSGPYVDVVLKELEAVRELLGEKRVLNQMSWGGGTPTFLSVSEIERLFSAIDRSFTWASGADISIEIDPRVTSDEQLVLLRKLGFTRVSLGVQDFDEGVQKAIHREQSFEDTKRIYEGARALGFKGINFDLIYGLPLQTRSTFEATVKKVVELRPDRIALYNYARLPHLLKHQQLLEKFPYVSADERVDLFCLSYESFLEHRYRAIGMDHFALHDDDLALASDDGRLYRNFMGYVVKHAEHLVGLGVSSIGEVSGAFFQNEKDLARYEERIAAEGLAPTRGHVLSEDDLKRQWCIQSLLCRFSLEEELYERTFGENFSLSMAKEKAALFSFIEDGILEETSQGFRVTDLGRLFVRNVAMVFDAYLKKSDGVVYSKTV